MTRTRQSRWIVTYTRQANHPEHVTILALTAELAAEHARTHVGTGVTVTVTGVEQAPARPRKAKAPKVDGFDAWAASVGELATTQVNGFEVVDNEHGTRDGRPMFETIAEFAFAVEAAAGAEVGRLFA